MFGRKDKQESPYAPIDIAYKAVKTSSGVKYLLTTADERRKMRESIRRRNPALEIIESAPPAKRNKLGWIDEIESFNVIFDD